MNNYETINIEYMYNFYDSMLEVLKNNKNNKLKFVTILTQWVTMGNKFIDKGIQEFTLSNEDVNVLTAYMRREIAKLI